MKIVVFVSEPGVYPTPGKGQATLSGKQIGEDYIQFRNILDRFPNLGSPKLIGPDTVELHDEPFTILTE